MSHRTESLSPQLTKTCRQHASYQLGRWYLTRAAKNAVCTAGDLAPAADTHGTLACRAFKDGYRHVLGDGEIVGANVDGLVFYGLLCQATVKVALDCSESGVGLWLFGGRRVRSTREWRGTDGSRFVAHITKCESAERI